MPREGHDSLGGHSPDLDRAFQSTCPARGTTRSRHYYGEQYRISIHVPREGHDRTTARQPADAITYFNPRAPRGARPGSTRSALTLEKFQSTCPARGTTIHRGLDCFRVLISIHVPREGHDVALIQNLPTIIVISIHVPREGHDKRGRKPSSRLVDFNPRAPRGARPRKARC